MYLTGREIKDLAEYAGFTIEPLGAIDEDTLEQEFYIHGSVKGVTGHQVQNDDGSVEVFSHVVTCDGCDSNECTPLGEPIKA